MPLTIPPSTYASQITFNPTTNITANTVQNAIVQLYDLMAHLSGDESIGGLKRFTDTTQATNTTTGTRFDGGVGIAKNLHVGGNLVADNLPKASAIRTSSTSSLSTSAVNKIVFNSEEVDNQNIHNISTGNSVIPSEYAGDYCLETYISGTFTTDGTATTRLRLSVYKNGSFF
ncbi:hypothetical protein ACX27_14770 [Nostoc piscinale CENA21]|nr:hypothetical protein [Nostoc piscinale]ALF53825.1 hypothetical protein ACX27_14770 [Nostoc piscinale CENA21]